MANLNLLDSQIRKDVIASIKVWDNIKRKRDSLRDYEIYNDRMYEYVRSELVRQLSLKTADSMPIISNLNVAKRVIQKQASIYTDNPEREYEGVSDADEQVLNDLYDDAGFDTSLQKANRYFVLRNQSFINIIPKDKCLKMRILHGHNVDVIPDIDDPEKAYAYIVSSFDKTGLIKSNNSNELIADADDYKASLERYQVWTNEYSFICNGRGEFVEAPIPNPIQMLPFIDVSKDKDFEFFVRMGQALTDFTVDFNVAWSDLMYISRLQGFNIGVLSGDPDLKPDDLTVGPNKMMFLPHNPAQPDSKLEFDFKSPTPNIDASLKAIDSLISTFMTTRGLEAHSVSSGSSPAKTYSSAIERLLAMIDQFSATKEDFDLFKVVEGKVHKITAAWLSVLTGTDYLDQEYWVQQNIADSEMEVVFKKPEMLETTAEQLDNQQKRVNLGISDRVTALMAVDGISEPEAVTIIDSIDQRKNAKLQAMVQTGTTMTMPNMNSPLGSQAPNPLDNNSQIGIINAQQQIKA